MRGVPSNLVEMHAPGPSDEQMHCCTKLPISKQQQVCAPAAQATCADLPNCRSSFQPARYCHNQPYATTLKGRDETALLMSAA